MNDIRVIGIGSPFGNDNIGWRVIERLRQHRAITSLLEPIDLIDCDRPGVNLIPLLAGAKCVVLIDAILAADQHGEVIQLDAEQLMNSPGALSSHDLDAAAAMTLAATLHSLPETLYIIGLGIDVAQTALLGPEHIDKLTDKVMSLLDADSRCRIPA
jgi:hydrogenase maturation protease